MEWGGGRGRGTVEGRGGVTLRVEGTCGVGGGGGGEALVRAEGGSR